MRGIVITGTHSGCGKTTVTLGILAALKKKGFTVQPFKTGPDFIDAGLHRLVVDRPSRNLDQWMCGSDYVIDCFNKHSANADIAVIEGVMGMYDGEFSTAHLAGLLGVPVVLVVDAYGMAESAGAVVKGFSEFRVQNSKFAVKQPRLAGIIFNRVASENHYKRLKDSVQDIPVLGYVPRELNFEIPHRHLGLTVAEENPLRPENVEGLADTVLKHIDIDEIVRSAALTKEQSYHREGAKVAKETRTFKVAVAYDKAFSFYYEDNLDLLREAGAEIIRFSPIEDNAVPDTADALYIGGGYPELHADALSRNSSMLGSLRAWSDAGKPVYAECGGLMYLSQGIRDFDNAFFAMAGVLPFKTRMIKKPMLAYRKIVLNENCILGVQGDRCRGHEFHYSEMIEQSSQEDFGETSASSVESFSRAAGVRSKEPDNTVQRIYAVKNKAGEQFLTEGFRIKNTLASYIHVHFGSNLHIAERFAGFVKGDLKA